MKYIFSLANNTIFIFEYICPQRKHICHDMIYITNTNCLPALDKVEKKVFKCSNLDKFSKEYIINKYAT